MTPVLAIAAFGAESDPLLKPGRRLAVIDTPHIHALVPADAAEALRPRILRAEAIYVHLAKDAGYEITAPLTLWVADDVDTHNGFSTVVPRPLVEIELAPSLPRGGIFDGGDEFERTLVHELTHHITNDRVYGLHRVMGSIFGRVFPSDYLSLVTAYFTVPPHVTMPLFWHEGLAQWSETAYADPDSPWAGRGRDSLTHLVWRLDAEAGAIPPAADWRASNTRWPFGNAVYLYGLAYTRYLDAAYGDRASPWRISDHQAHGWPFLFDGGPVTLLGKSHAELIEEARTALWHEQATSLAKLNAVKPTTLRRLTPPDTLVAAPAWMPDGRLLTAYSDPWDTSRLALVDATGDLDWTSAPAYDRGEARSLPDGTAVYAEALGSAGDQWARSRVVIRWPDGGRDTLDGERLLQPDLRPVTKSKVRAVEIASVRLLPGGRQELATTTWRSGLLWGHTAAWKTFPTEGRPWHPTFRPGHDELAWVETDAAGSRLVLAPLADPARRTVLAEVRGRLIHPCWTRDGTSLFVCADHTGVPNAYRIDLATPKTLVPVTNVIGAVTACVPGPDGRELALVAFDRHGPFLARIPNDPATFPPSVPSITLAWPAPITERPQAMPASGNRMAPTPLSAPGEPAAAADGSLPGVRSYWGPRELRFLFWSPTTFVTRDGGLGVQALLADPVYTNQVTVGVGVGDVEGQAVGSASYTWSPWAIGFSVAAWRSELTYTDEIVDAALREYDYTETRSTVEARAGYRLLGNERRVRANVALGTTRYRAVDASTERYAGQTILSVDPFTGTERYIEGTLGWADTSSYPTSYTKEDGPTLIATARQSGLGGDLYRKRLTTSGSYTWSLFKRLGHQVVGAGWVGWSDPDGATTLQGAFDLGGSANPYSPRGYPERIVTGYYSLGYSVAYRLPVWRPFANFGTTPFGFRQLVIEPFLDGGQVSTDHVHGNGGWYRAAGGELAADWEVWALRLDPVVGVAKQLDGAEDVTTYVRLGFRW